VPAHHADSLTQLPDFADLAKYKVFDNIIAITNNAPEDVSSSADFSKASIDRRIAAGYRDAKIALTEPPKRAADIAKAITLPAEGHAKWSSKQGKIEETNKKPSNGRALEFDRDYGPISELLAKRRAAVTTPVGDWRPSATLPTAPQADIVDISVFGPESLRAGSQCLVQVYLHLLDQAAAVLALAKEFNPEATRRGVKTLATEIARGTPIVVILEGHGLSVDHGKQDLVWRGIPDACEFTVAAPAGSAGQSFYPRILVLVNSVPIGSVTFALRVTAVERLAANEIRGERARRYSYAFLSYASPNRAEVLKRVQGLKAARINFFQDLLTLEPGEHWEKRLYEEIDACDLFLLFWSTEAKASPWVMKEVEHALNRQKKSPDQLPHITPVIIEGPPPPSPPEMWRDIHFNDSLIWVLGAVQAQPARTP
jgi:hypothetical protein